MIYVLIKAMRLSERWRWVAQTQTFHVHWAVAVLIIAISYLLMPIGIWLATLDYWLLRR